MTLADGIDYLDGKHCVFGHVVEGFDTLDRINEAFLDKEGRPLQDIRIRHVEVLGESSLCSSHAYLGSVVRRLSRIPLSSSLLLFSVHGLLAYPPIPQSTSSTSLPHPAA